jgi:hypothetical protein
MRFYGNRCRHYTKQNTTTSCRVSIDFRVTPARLFSAPLGVVNKATRGAKPLLEGQYYARMRYTPPVFPPAP